MNRRAEPKCAETEEVREHYRKEKEDYEGVRLLIWISVGSQQVRPGLKCYSKLDQGLGFGRTKKKENEKCKSGDLGLDPNLS